MFLRNDAVLVVAEHRAMPMTHQRTVTIAYTLEAQQALLVRARRDQARALAALTVAALKALWTQCLKLHRPWVWTRVRADLHASSDHTLKDIGLERSQIDLLFR